ncbi:Uncharacterised protein [Mycobacteroides abscessus]|nr:hypothetical protein MMAS_27820 [Mycobacteroides abscessus subsp. massiliense CCUG 48898 = JCM 15300]CPU35510.1 Uncharacterised protein [Mycobacteroides abscessus]CPX57513.1 Uncharacterised protein [Mycobacteroides abscessus]CPZ36187.1 Uncharacterised protein [Mycobacteroides abscessus]
MIAAVTKRLSELNLSAAEDMNRYVEQTINSPTFKLWRSEADLPAE